MADSLRDWLGPRIVETLETALENHEGGGNTSYAITESYRILLPGSLVIPLKKVRLLQIVEVSASFLPASLKTLLTCSLFDDNTRTATLSDRTSFIHANIDETAINEYTQVTGTGIANIAGAILGITKVHLVGLQSHIFVGLKLTFVWICNLENPHQEPLKLQVLSFVSKGCEGSPMFGRPSYVARREDIQISLKRLKAAIQKDQSQPGFDAISNIHDTSQSNFATQMPFQAEKVPRKHRSDSGRDASVAHASLAAIISGFSRGNFRKPEHISSINPQSSRKQILQPVSEDRLSSITSKLVAKANIAQSGPTSSSQSTKNSDEPHSQTFMTQNLHLPGYFSQGAHDSEKENSQESLDDQKLPKVGEESSSKPENLSTQEECVSILFFDQMQEMSPFRSLKRVPRKYIRISDAQQNLLERSDTWFKYPSSNEREFANVPPNIFEDLNTFTVRKRRQNSISRGNQFTESAGNIGSETSSQGGEDDEKLDHTEDVDDGDELSVHSHHSQTLPNMREGVRSIATSSIARGAAPKVEEEMDDEELTSWPSSPNINHRDNVSPVSPTIADIKLSGTRSPVVSAQNTQSQAPCSPLGSSRSNDIVQSTSASHRENSQSPEYQEFSPPESKRWHSQTMPDIPSSSSTEDEMDFELPHAIGDLFDTRIEVAKQPESHDIALTNPTKTVIQVEQTPFLSRGISHKIRGKVRSSPRKRVSDVMSSDPIIPATFNDEDAPCEQSPESLRNMTVEPKKPNNDKFGFESEPLVYSPKVLLSQEQDQTYNSSTIPYQHSGNLDVDDSHPGQDVSPSNPISCLGPSDSFLAAVIPRSDIDNLAEVTSHRSSIPSLKRRQESPDQQLSGPAIKRQRRSPTTDLNQHEDEDIDPKEMARRYRRQFCERLAQGSADLPRDTNLIPHAHESYTKETSPTHRQERLSQNRPRSSNTRTASDSQSTISHKTQENQSQARNSSKKDSNGLQSQQVDFERMADGTQQTLYEVFESTYPEYRGSQRAFIRALVCLEWLQSVGKLVQRLHYDDFIRVMDADYKEYLRDKVAGRGSQGKQMSCYEFYNKRTFKVKFEGGVITPENLREALAALELNYVSEIRSIYNAETRVASGVNSPREGSESINRDEGSGREASPELGDIDNAAILKKRRDPFFTTKSQLTTAERNSASTINATTPKGKHRSSLPWATATLTSSPNADQPPRRDRLEQLPHGKRIVSGEGSKGRTPPARRRSPLQRTTPSPILGSNPGPVSTSSGLRHDVEIANPRSRKRPISTEETDESMTKVEGWLAHVTPEPQQKSHPRRTTKPSFKEFLARRRSAGLLSSKTSTPNSTPAKRVCTRPKGVDSPNT